MATPRTRSPVNEVPSAHDAQPGATSRRRTEPRTTRGIPPCSTRESKLFCFKMKCDFYRYFAEFATSDAKNKVAEDARVAHAEATKVGIVLKFSVLKHGVLQVPDEARVTRAR